jgi:hypothetical protein
LTIAILVFLALVLALIAFFRLVLALLTALLALSRVLPLPGLASLLSRLTALLVLVFHITHKDLFSSEDTIGCAFRIKFAIYKVSCCKMLQRLGSFVSGMNPHSVSGNVLSR